MRLFRRRRRLGRLRQRLRLVGIGIEVGDDVGALLLALDAAEGHQRSRHVLPRVLDPRVEVLERPGAALRFERLRVVEAWYRGDRAADHAEEVWADLRAAALGHVVAGQADLGGLFAGLRRGAGE